MANKTGYIYDALGNKVAVKTTADQVVTGLDGLRSLEDELADINNRFTAAEDDTANIKNSKNAAGGFAGLDENAKLYMEHMPNIMTHNKGYFAEASELEAAHEAAAAGDYAIIGSTDTVWLWDTQTSQWVDSGTKGSITSVNGYTGEVTLTKSDLGLGNADDTADLDKPISAAVQEALDEKAVLGIIGDSAYTF